MSTDGDHEGKSRWIPDKDILEKRKRGGCKPNRRYRNQRPNRQTRGSKQKAQILNAWLERDRNPDINAITSTLNVSGSYARRITEQQDSGEFTEDERAEMMDWDIRRELRDRIEQHEPTDKDTDTEPSMSTTTTDSDLERGEKKHQIINAYLLDETISPADLDDVLPASYEYIRRELKKLKDREYSDDTIDEERDEDTQQELREKLEQEGIELNTNTTPTESGSDTPDEAESEGDIGEWMDLTKDNPFEQAGISKRQALVNIFVHDSNIAKQKAADLADASAEYARQTYKGIQDGTFNPNEFAINSLLAELEKRDEDGELEAYLEGEDVTAEEPDADVPSETSTSDEEITPDDTGSESLTEPGVDVVSAGDIAEIRDTADLFLRQAQFESDGEERTRAEFVAKELRDQLDDLLES